MDKFVQKRFAPIPDDTEGIGKNFFYHNPAEVHRGTGGHQGTQRE